MTQIQLLTGFISLILLLNTHSCEKTLSTSIGLSNNVQIQIVYTYRRDRTDFVVNSRLNGDFINNGWISFGLKNDQNFDNFDFILCDSNGFSVKHYKFTGNNFNLLDAANDGIGLSNKQVTNTNQNFTCTFTRENTYGSVNPYYTLSNNSNPYFLLAYGKESRLEFANERKKASDSTNNFSYSGNSSSLIEANKSLFVLIVSIFLIAFNF